MSPWKPVAVSQKARRLAAASQVARRAIDKLRPAIANITWMRMHEGVDATDNAKLQDASGKLNATRNATAGVSHLIHSTMKSSSEKMRHLQGLRIQKNVVKAKGGAQCGELSEYVFYRCYKEGLFPIHEIFADNCDLWDDDQNLDNHVFVAIGLTNPGKYEDMAAWPDDVVICDPWVMELVRGTANEKTRNPGAYTVTEYMNLVRRYFLDGSQVEVLYGHDAPILATTGIRPAIGGTRATS